MPYNYENFDHPVYPLNWPNPPQKDTSFDLSKEGRIFWSIFAVFVTFIVFCVCFSICCQWRRKKSNVKSKPVFESPVVVTSATHTAPGGYPVTQLPPPGYPPNPPNVYSPAPYPAQTTGNVTVQMPMPQPGMPTHGVTPYPPMPQPGSMNPPSYDMAVANPGPSVIPSSYEKQAPYNPTYGQ
ncbi:protein shisa-5 isoform X2 [Drosophila willistoni]|uniref:protein shisa-5 isoform X2 n=1 Tax=Drosophila willistoni TaxID=7260 RepID=UPI000C26C498|nr:protein shisa-5 isoform X2 [Drosophila willistoni]